MYYKHRLDQFGKKKKTQNQNKQTRSVAKPTMVFNRAAKLLKRFPKSYFKIATLISVIAKKFPKSQRNVTLVFKNLSSSEAVKLLHTFSGGEARKIERAHV